MVEIARLLDGALVAPQQREVARPLEDIVHQLETVQKANGAMLRGVAPRRPRSERRWEDSCWPPAVSLPDS